MAVQREVARMSSATRHWVLLGCNILLPVAILIFASGFFPYKPFIAGRNEFSAAEQLSRPDPIFDRVIFMVVDALRSDFVYSQESGFTFVQQLIKNGNALPFTAHASSPTITMPKVKAITTGSVPSFLDVILNFAESDTTSTLAHTDTWLDQLRHLPNGKLVMYGDDTWLKLFPGFFDRQDGTSSFFVSDFTEVDNNVTRHIANELARDDWNGWFMHYLGMDHIGHKSGPESPHMFPKQREMDQIAQQIFRGLETSSHLASTLFVLCGDHGMNEAGNHGGAAPGETSPALVFMSPKFKSLDLTFEVPATPKGDFQYYEVVEQSDIAPTIAGLLGFPVPLNNLGVLIPEFLTLWREESEQLHLVIQNARQMHAILVETLGSEPFEPEQLTQLDCENRTSDLVRLQCGWMALSTEGSAWQLSQTERLDRIFEYLHTAQTVLSSTASNYDLNRLMTGILIAALTFLMSTVALISCCSKSHDQQGISGTALLTALYSAMMFASSFVEEEHHFWYWASTLVVCWLFQLRTLKQKLECRSVVSFCLTLALVRLLRRWNQTGQKFAGNPDIGRTFLKQHNLVLWLLVTATYAFFGIRLATHRVRGISNTSLWAFAALLSVGAAVFRVEFTRADAPELLSDLEPVINYLRIPMGLVNQARVVFSLVGFGLGSLFWSAGALRQSPKGRQQFLTIARNILFFFLATQTRVNNIPLLLLFEGIFWNIQHFNKYTSHRSSPFELALVAIVLQYACFFAFGGTNAISSIDLSNAYNGVSGYNVIAVGILTFVSNWIGPIWWALAAAEFLVSWNDTKAAFVSYALTMTFFVGCSLTATMVACTVLRTHLFIWTVFSPKYLYSMAWSLAQHLVINIGTTWSLIQVTT